MIDWSRSFTRTRRHAPHTIIGTLRSPLPTNDSDSALSLTPRDVNKMVNTQSPRMPRRHCRHSSHQRQTMATLAHHQSSRHHDSCSLQPSFPQEHIREKISPYHVNSFRHTTPTALSLSKKCPWPAPRCTVKVTT